MNESLHTWQNFYFMAGGASATLLGLMFVALSLGTHLINQTTSQGVEAFVTPSVFYFVTALLICLTMLVPSYESGVLGLVLVVGGGGAFARTSRFINRIVQAARKHQDFDVQEWLTQVIFPTCGYSLILVAGVGFVGHQWSWAFDSLAVATVLLMLSAIANTWSLVLWIIDQHEG